jgi:putative tricarboxylic transport membrane protein
VGSWDVFFGLFFLAAGAYIYLEARTFPNLAGGYPGPGLFPQILGALLALSGLALAATAVAARNWPKQLPLSRYGAKEKTNALLVLVAIAFYILFVERLGFIPTVFLIAATMMVRTGVSPARSAIFSAALTLGAYAIFNRALNVPLPNGILDMWL